MGLRFTGLLIEACSGAKALAGEQDRPALGHISPACLAFHHGSRLNAAGLAAPATVPHKLTVQKPADESHNKVSDQTVYDELEPRHFGSSVSWYRNRSSRLKSIQLRLQCRDAVVGGVRGSQSPQRFLGGAGILLYKVNFRKMHQRMRIPRIVLKRGLQVIDGSVGIGRL